MRADGQRPAPTAAIAAAGLNDQMDTLPQPAGALVQAILQGILPARLQQPFDDARPLF